MNEDKIIEKLEQHDNRFDKHDKRFDAHDKQFDRVVNKLMEHDDQFREIRETMATKKDFEMIVRTQDQMLVILNRLDQERHFTNEAVRRLQDGLEEQKEKIDEHDKLLKRIKLDLKIA